MARQYRMNSLEIYDKLGMKKKTYKIEDSSAAETGVSLPESAFYMTEAKSFRTMSATVVKRVEHSPVNFKKQLPRPDFMQHSPVSMHENRFLAYNDHPAVSTRHHSVNSPRFSNYLGRARLNSQQMHKEYTLNYTSVDKCPQLVPFSTQQGRSKPLSTAVVYDKLAAADFSKLDANISVPQLEKSPSKHLKEPLPLFMVGLDFRNDALSLKSLSMNGYMNTDYPPLSSSFGTNWKPEASFPIPIRGRCPKIVKVLRKKLKMP